MSLRKKILISLVAIILLIIALLTLNSYMAREEGRYVQRLLWIHHQYTTLLNLKNEVNQQLSEAQEIFIYGKALEDKNFSRTLAAIGQRVKALSDALPFEGPAAINNHELSSYQRASQQKLRTLRSTYEDLYGELVLMTRLLQVGRKAKAQEHFQSEISLKFKRLFSQIDEWVNIQKQELRETEADFVRLNDRHNRTSLVALSAILLMVLIFSAIIVSLLGPRLNGLLRGTERIAKGDFSTAVSEKGHDELSRLSRAMNQMMAELAASRKKLLEQSYYSGMADMVSGTLHNLRNSLSPVIVDLEMIGDDLQEVSLERIRKAVDEIGSPGNDPARHTDLVEYLNLAGAALEAKMSAIVDDLSSVRKRIDIIEKVLNEQSHYVEMERPLEDISLRELIEDCLGLVKKDYLDRGTVAADESVGAIGTVRTQRIVLVQILANLVSNALESIIRSEREGGLVTITAAINEQGRVHVRVIDNGEGIASDMLQKIFERGVSSSHEGYGLGLHWSANSVASLQGKLYAESDGPGCGATMHLIL